MMTYERYIRDEENAAYGRFLVETIANLYGCDETAEAVNRAVYKNTDCGAWINFDETGIVVGTIVEGSDAEYSERIDLDGVGEDDEGTALLITRFRAAINNCEDFAKEHWEGK